jgi:hypothetical protein
MVQSKDFLKNDQTRRLTIRILESGWRKDPPYRWPDQKLITHGNLQNGRWGSCSKVSASLYWITYSSYQKILGGQCFGERCAYCHILRGKKSEQLAQSVLDKCSWWVIRDNPSSLEHGHHSKFHCCFPKEFWPKWKELRYWLLLFARRAF